MVGIDKTRSEMHGRFTKRPIASRVVSSGESCRGGSSGVESEVLPDCRDLLRSEAVPGRK